MGYLPPVQNTSRAAAFVGGGYVPESARNTSVNGMIAIADWFVAVAVAVAGGVVVVVVVVVVFTCQIAKNFDIVFSDFEI